MTVGRISKPLKILLLDPAMQQWPEFTELEAQGHEITWPQFDEGRYDLVLGDHAWRMTEELRPYLGMAIKAARKVKYPAQEKKK